MKLLIFIVAAFLSLTSIRWESDPFPSFEEEQANYMSTGIILDSMDNEVYLQFLDDKPIYYYSNIFTPVCQSGKCLPIHIKIYWNLKGEYLRYERPPGKIFTKLDHEPFTDADYQLLHEIMQGADPRTNPQVKHSSPGGNLSQRDQQSSPAPAVAMTVLKADDMLDGISGATLPELEDRFVPGALYTTYTCWELANLHEWEMLSYTREYLFGSEHPSYFLGCKACGCRGEILSHMISQSKDDDPLPDLLLGILDTAQGSTAIFAVGQFRYYDLELEKVQNGLKDSYFSSQDLELKQRILWRLSGDELADSHIHQFLESMPSTPTLVSDIINLFRWRETWPDGIVQRVLQALTPPEMESNRSYLMEVLEDKLDDLSKEERNQIKEAKKKYNL